MVSPVTHFLFVSLRQMSWESRDRPLTYGVRPTYLSIPGTDKGGKRQVFSLVIAEMFSRDRAIEASRKVQGNVVAVLFLLYQQNSYEMSATKDTKRITLPAEP